MVVSGGERVRRSFVSQRLSTSYQSLFASKNAGYLKISLILLPQEVESSRIIAHSFNTTREHTSNAEEKSADDRPCYSRIDKA